MFPFSSPERKFRQSYCFQPSICILDFFDEKFLCDGQGAVRLCCM